MNRMTEFETATFRHFRKSPESIMKPIMAKMLDDEEKKICLEMQLSDSMNTDYGSQ